MLHTSYLYALIGTAYQTLVLCLPSISEMVGYVLDTRSSHVTSIHVTTFKVHSGGDSCRVRGRIIGVC
jgi:hypothetical protein